ncbi:hypothetical protein L2E82_17869 [Cichorium intybus]|uniref:Uncharacterized protein n=1 Tax=Cichorium intybus TaxID=13427 RepID=A0ACB9F8Z3_CICIN|nr:hypothetical protein L2E82_17869 [Cichorium intybus]
MEKEATKPQTNLKSVVVKPQRIRSVIVAKEDRIRDEVSYAEIVKGGVDKKIREEVVSGGANRFKKHAEEVAIEDDCQEVTVIPSEEDEMNGRNSLIGDVLNYDLLLNIFDMPRLEGLCNVMIWYIGGMNVVIKFESESMAEDFLLNAKNTWSNWFGNLVKWHPDYSCGHRLASIDIMGVPFLVWKEEVFEEIARLWGKPVWFSNIDNVNFNKEVKKVGILTSEPPWINESIKVNIKGVVHHVRVIENYYHSYNMAPKVSNSDQEQFSEEEWVDMVNADLVNDEGEAKENTTCPDSAEGYPSPRQEDTLVDRRMGIVEHKEQVPRKGKDTRMDIDEHAMMHGEESVSGNYGNFGLGENNPCSNSPISGHTEGGPVGPYCFREKASLVPDLNDSPNSSGFFPFIQNVDVEDEDFDLGGEDDIEQAISDEIERKRKLRKKGSKYPRNPMEANRGSQSNFSSGSQSKNSRQDEINQTIRIGEEIGVNWNGCKELVDKVIDAEGGNRFRC